MNHLNRGLILAIVSSSFVLSACTTTDLKTHQCGDGLSQVPSNLVRSATKRNAEVDCATYLAKRILIVDTHIDVPYRLEAEPSDVTMATDSGDFDYPRARAGGLNAPFMSIYIPAEKEPEGTAKTVADKLIDGMESLAASAPNKFAIAKSTDDVYRQFDSGLISLPLGMENGAPIEGNLKNLEYYYERGIRYITLTHSKSNHISDSSYDDNKQWQGLSPFGKTLVPAMNKVGVMVDVSHVSDQAFWDVIAISETPVIASHSSARHFTPGFERNMSDDMIVALAKNGGVIMINFGSTFIDQDSRDSSTALSEARTAYLEAEGLVDDDEASEAFAERYRKANPFRFTDLDRVLDHFDHVKNLVGIDYVGIGSDYDGVGDSLPEGLKDVPTYPNLVAGLLERGYSEADIVKILSGNIMRVWEQIEIYAEHH